MCGNALVLLFLRLAIKGYRLDKRLCHSLGIYKYFHRVSLEGLSPLSYLPTYEAPKAPLISFAPALREAWQSRLFKCTISRTASQKARNSGLDTPGALTSEPRYVSACEKTGRFDIADKAFDFSTILRYRSSWIAFRITSLPKAKAQDFCPVDRLALASSSSTPPLLEPAKKIYVRTNSNSRNHFLRKSDEYTRSFQRA